MKCVCGYEIREIYMPEIRDIVKVMGDESFIKSNLYIKKEDDFFDKLGIQVLICPKCGTLKIPVELING